jgi:pimeloyl-ACP methyl ester carboxylesterase
MFTPVQILGLWFRGLLSLAVIGGAGYSLREWYRRSWVYDLDARRHVFDFDPGWNAETAFLAAGLALLAWSLLGGLISRLASRLLAGGAEADDPGHEPIGEVRRIRRADGTELLATVHGPADAPPVVLTHGWGANKAEWNYLKRELGDRARLIAWDLPGLGGSARPPDNDHSLENMARALDEVLVATAGGRPAVLVGHSIGGMITLTYARLFPEALGTRVAGLALVQTTYTNPVRTTRGASIYTALEGPVLVPLLRLTIALSPLFRVLSWLSYLNGSAHQSTRRSGFAGRQRPGQVNFMARFQPHAPPSVVARGMFGMLAYDATATLPTIDVPTLVVPGDRDTVCLPEASERMIREIPGARSCPLSPGKHMALIEHHGDFAEALAGFVAKCCGSGLTRPAAG